MLIRPDGTILFVWINSLHIFVIRPGRIIRDRPLRMFSRNRNLLCFCVLYCLKQLCWRMHFINNTPFTLWASNACWEVQLWFSSVLYITGMIFHTKDICSLYLTISCKKQKNKLHYYPTVLKVHYIVLRKTFLWEEKDLHCLIFFFLCLNKQTVFVFMTE